MRESTHSGIVFCVFLSCFHQLLIPFEFSEAWVISNPTLAASILVGAWTSANRVGTFNDLFTKTLPVNSLPKTVFLIAYSAGTVVRI